MRLSLVRNIKENAILAKDILSNDGQILLKSGTPLSSYYLEKLKKLGVFLAYIEDSSLEDIHEDIHLDKLKQVCLRSLPAIFNNLLTGNEALIQTSLCVLEDLIDYIIEEGAVNINLYEVKCYDDYTYIHSIDTGIMSVFLGAAMKYSKSELKTLGISAILHDIGKTKIPHSIINKEGSLNKEEFDYIKLHPFYGKEILSKISFLSTSIINGVAEHHERFDGTGYPFGLTNNEICDFAKIISVCDVFTAVSANRSYRNRFEPKEAYELILSASNTMFDPKIIQCFKDTFAIYPLGCCVRLSNGIEGFVIKQNFSFPDRPVIRVLYDENKQKIPSFEIDLLTSPHIVIDSVVLT